MNAVKLGRLCAEPYRLFFPAAVLIGIAGVGHWLFYGAGWISSYSGRMHSAVQMQGYMPGFVLGFLLTAFPRFTASRPGSAKEILPLLFLLLAAAALFFVSQRTAAHGCYAALMLLALRFVAARGGKRGDGISPLQPPLELIWVPFALLFGLLGAALSLGGELRLVPAWLLKAGSLMIEQGFVLAIVLGVGGFLGPRLMGVFRPDFHPAKIRTAEEESRLRRRRAALHFACALLLLASFFLEAAGNLFTANLVRASVVSLVFVKARVLHAAPLNKDPFVRLIQASFWMIFTGYWSIVFAPAHRVALLHIIFLGGYSLMTFAVATMVALSHSGAAAELRKWSWALVLTAAGLSLALGLRLASTYFPEKYFTLLAAASICWLTAASGWLIYISPFLLRFPAPGETERLHEEAKKKILRQRQGAEDGANPSVC